MVVNVLKRIVFICMLVFIMGVSVACKKADKNAEPQKEQDVETDEIVTCTVDFIDYDGSVLERQVVEANKNATAPQDPVRGGYIFMGWDKELTNVIEDMTVTAQYLEDTAPLLMLDSIEAKAGDSIVKMNLSVKNNPGILGMTLSVQYDEKVMTLKEVENGEAVADVLTLTASKELRSGCHFAWDGQEILAEDIKDGTILSLSFDIEEAADNGTYTVVLMYEDIYNNDVMPVTMDVKNGSITIR